MHTPNALTEPQRRVPGRVENTNVSAVERAVTLAVKRYNEERPHWKLPGQLSPVQFENYVNKLPKYKRPKMQLYKGS